MADENSSNQEQAGTPEQTGGGVTYPQKAGVGLIVAGWIFAVLGGLIGVAIGAVLMGGKVKTDSGEKVRRYDEKSRKRGIPILIVAIIMTLFWNFIALTGGDIR